MTHLSTLARSIAATTMMVCCLVLAAHGAVSPRAVTGGSTVPVILPTAAGASGINAVFADGTTPTNGGLDTHDYALSANLLGTSITWSGATFTLAAPAAVDGVSNATVALPTGSFTTLKLLGLGMNGNQPAQSFVVTYTDGTASTFTQDVSDWWGPQSYAGETTVLNMAYCVIPSGGKCPAATALYGYSFAVNSAKTVKSLTLPKNRNVVVLAADMLGGTVTAPPTNVSLSGAANVYALFNDGTVPTHGGLVGSGYAVSANLVGASVAGSGVTFTVGSAGAPDAVSSTTVALPAGSFTGLKLLAMGAHGNQANQAFVVTYTDGTTTTFTQSLSDWWASSNNSGETTLLNMAYCVTPSGGMCPVKTALYGYSFAVNSAKTVKSLTLPNNRNVVVLAAALTGSGTIAPVDTLAFSATTYAVAQNAQTAQVMVTRTGTPSSAVSVHYATANGSGVAGTLYTAVSGTLQWAANDASSKTLSIPISNASPFTGSETFNVALSNPSTGAELNGSDSTTVTVTGDAVPNASLQLTAITNTVPENAGSITLSATRSGGTTAAVSVAYATAGGTAVAGTNYTSANGTLNWAANDSSAKSIKVTIDNVAGMLVNGNFTVSLSAPSAGATVGPNATTTVTITPLASGSASNATKLESYLSGLAKGNGGRELSGQHADIWNSDSNSTTLPMDAVNPILTQTGQLPAMLGLVLNYATDSYAYTVAVTNTLAQQWWAKGGIVFLSLYSNDPTFSYNSTGAPTSTSIPSSAFHSLTDKNSAAYKQWHSQLDTYAAALHTLTDSGNVILFRPFIELNGNWNWYGQENTADFVAVWQDMHDYLMITKGLKNVLWVYNVNDNVGNYTTYYPGPTYVDIVSMDIYDTSDKIVADANSGNMYQLLSATGKPLFFGELGLSTAGGSNGPPYFTLDDNSNADAIRQSLPNVVGFLVFNLGWAIPRQNDAAGLMNNTWLVNLDDLPSSY